jgi:hypothetical protein
MGPRHRHRFSKPMIPNVPENSLSAIRRGGILRTVPRAEQPPELTIMQAMMRMRCRTCRGRVETAALDNNASGWRVRVVQIWRAGPQPLIEDASG